MIVQLLLLPGIRDTQCGFKAFTAEAATRIFSISGIDGWGFDVEILSLAKKSGYRIKEVPVRWANDTRSHVTFSAGFEFLRDIATIRAHLWAGSYTRRELGPSVIILAAGEGKRMGSDIAKPLHVVAGKTVLQRTIESIKPLTPDPIVVIGNRGDAIMAALGKQYSYVWQKEQRGTGHAVMCVKDAPEGAALRESVIILPSDNPLIGTGTIEQLFKSHRASGATVSLCTVTVPAFEGDYAPFADSGRIKRDKHGKIQGIVEVKDATEQEKMIKEVNVGYYCFNTRWLFEKITKLENKNKLQEFYLTDMLQIAVREKAAVNSCPVEKFQEGLGFNTPEQLANILKIG